MKSPRAIATSPRRIARNSAGVGVSSEILRIEKYWRNASTARWEGFRLSCRAGRSTRRPTAAGSSIVYARLLISNQAYHLTKVCQESPSRSGALLWWYLLSRAALFLFDRMTGHRKAVGCQRVGQSRYPSAHFEFGSLCRSALGGGATWRTEETQNE
jgi:hypothetical protein